MSFYRGSVARTKEFERIKNIPRRRWTPEEAREAAEKMTEVLRTPKGTMKLFPLQGAALTEIGLYGGLFGPIPVGEGKTLISLLAPYVLDASRPVLLLPAALIEKTHRERIKYSKHFLIPLNIRMFSIESLGRASMATALEAYHPDLVIIDEAHRVKNKKAGVVRRLIRLVDKFPDTKFIIMSGTMTRDGLDDFEHLSSWTLGDNSPVPKNRAELNDWCEVLDRKRDLRRIEPGALMELCNEEEAKKPRFEAARLGFNRRLNDTPGVISSSGADVPCSIYVSSVTYDVAPVTEENFKKLRGTWKTPDDWELMQAVDVWRHSCELALGFHHVWRPRPPQEWRSARANWNKYVRKVLSSSRSLDTPQQVQIAVTEGDIPGRELLDAWKNVEDTFRPNTVAVWHDDSCLKACEAWGKQSPGIIWTEFSYFGRELARRTGWEYFGREGVNASGVPIDAEGAAHEGKTIIASRKANSTGRNLQAWNRNLVTSIPGSDMEQLIGRTHRPGQEADTVYVDIVIACAEHLVAWSDAVARAKMVHDMMGQTQKLLLADVSLDERKLSMLQGHRWSRTLSEKDNKFVLPNT